MSEVKPVSVLFVCLGNICRSPTAHGIFESLVSSRKLQSRITVDSCGTADWHTGRAPDNRSTAAAKKRGYDLSQLRARQVALEDFDRFDYIVAMDKQNLADLEAMKPADFRGYLGLFLRFATDASCEEVPDPYYGGDDGFADVLDMVEAASEGLLREINSADTAH